MPIGYKVDEDRHYQIDEAVAPYVLEAFERYDNGEKIVNIESVDKLYHSKSGAEFL